MLQNILDKINFNLFENCVNLTEIKIPERVEYVMSDAFRNCSGLTTLDLPESVTRIGYSPFYGCKLDSLLIRGFIENRWISSSIFEGMGTETKVYVQPSQVLDFQNVYQGMVYPLTDEMNDITDITCVVGRSTELYDLQGRKLSSMPAKGIYIQNGKKYVVR